MPEANVSGGIQFPLSAANGDANTRRLPLAMAMSEHRASSSMVPLASDATWTILVTKEAVYSELLGRPVLNWEGPPLSKDWSTAHLPTLHLFCPTMAAVALVAQPITMGTMPYSPRPNPVTMPCSPLASQPPQESQEFGRSLRRPTASRREAPRSRWPSASGFGLPSTGSTTTRGYSAPGRPVRPPRKAPRTAPRPATLFSSASTRSSAHWSI